MRMFALRFLAVVFCCLILHPALGAIGAPKSTDRPTAFRDQVTPVDTIVTYSYDLNGNRTTESGQALQTVLSNGAVTVATGGEEAITGSGNVVTLSGLSATLMVNGTGNRLVVPLASTADQLVLTQSGSDVVIGIVGTSAAYTVKNWYAALSNQFSEIDAADGSALTLTLAAQMGSVLSGPQQALPTFVMMQPVGAPPLMEPGADPSMVQVTWQPDTAAINALSLTSNGAPVSLSSLTILGEGQNLLGLGGNDLVIKDGSGDVDIWEFNAANAIIRQVGLTFNGTAAAIGSSTIIGEGQNLLGQGGNDLVFKDGSGYVDIWEFDNMGHIVRPLQMTYNGAAAAIGSSTIIGEGQNLLGQGGNDLIFKDGSGYVDIWEFNNLGQILRPVTLTYDGAAAAIGSDTIIGQGQNLLGQGGNDLIFKDGSGYIDIWEFSTTGIILRPLTLENSNDTAAALGSSTIIGEGLNLLSQGGNDLILKDSAGYVDILEFSATGIILRPLTLETSNGAGVALGGSTIIGEGQNLLGQGGNDLVFKDSAGDVDVWEFNATGIILRALTLTYDGAAAAIGSDTIIGQGQNLLGQGGNDLIFKDSAGYIDIWEISATGIILRPLTLENSNDTGAALGSSTIIGQGQNLLSQGGNDLILKDSAGYVDILEFSATGIILRPLTLETSNGTGVALGGSTLVGEGQNLLGQGGNDLVFKDSAGDVDVWEFSATGIILRALTLTYDGAAAAFGSSSIICQGQNLFGAGGHDLFFLNNGAVQSWEINSAGAITAVPASVDVQRLVQSLGSFGAGTNGTTFGGFGTSAGNFIVANWHIALPN